MSLLGYYLSAKNFCSQIIRSSSLEINKRMKNEQGPAALVPWIFPSDTWNDSRLISRDFLSCLFNYTW